MNAHQPRVLRVYHSAVVTGWRRREEELRELGFDVAVVAPRAWNEGGETVRLHPDPDEPVVAARTVGHHPFLFVYNPVPIWRELRACRPTSSTSTRSRPAWRRSRSCCSPSSPACRPRRLLYCAQNLEKRYPPPFRWLERAALRRAGTVHTCNDEAADILAKQGLPRDVVNLGLGVDVDRFRPVDDCRIRRWSARCGSATSAESRSHKGVFTLLAALGEVPGPR